MEVMLVLNSSRGIRYAFTMPIVKTYGPPECFFRLTFSQ